MPLIVQGLVDAAVEHDVAAGEQGPGRAPASNAVAGRARRAAWQSSGQSARSVTRSMPKSVFAAPGQRPDPGPTASARRNARRLRCLARSAGQLRGRRRLDQPRRVGRADRPRARRGSRRPRPRPARARRSACWSRPGRRRPPCARSRCRVVRNWATGHDRDVADGGSTGGRSARRRSASREGSPPVDGSARARSTVGLGVAVAVDAATGDGDGLPPESELAAGDGQRDGQREQAEDDEDRAAFHGRGCTSGSRRTRGTPRPGGRTGRREKRVDGGPDRIRTGDLQRDRLACWAATPRVQMRRGRSIAGAPGLSARSAAAPSVDPHLYSRPMRLIDLRSDTVTKPSPGHAPGHGRGRGRRRRLRRRPDGQRPRGARRGAARQGGRPVRRVGDDGQPRRPDGASARAATRRSPAASTTWSSTRPPATR